MDPPGAGSCCPAPSLEKTSAATESSRDIPLLNTGGDGGGISSFSSLCPAARVELSLGVSRFVWFGLDIRRGEMNVNKGAAHNECQVAN